MQSTSWAAGLELVGDDERCVALTGLLPVRLLAERAGLTAGISAAMRRPGYDPDYDRGQVLLDLGLVQLAGGQAIGDFQALAHLEKLIGPVPSTPTVWRALDEAGGLQVTRIHHVRMPVPAPVVGHPEVAARRVPLAESRRAGTDRDHGH